MKRYKSGKTIALMCAVLALALFFLFVACNDLTMDDSPLESAVTDALTAKTTDEPAAESDKTTDISDKNGDAAQSGESEKSATEGQTQEGQDGQTQGTETTNNGSSDNTQSQEETTSGTTQNGNETLGDATQEEEDNDTSEEEAPEVRDGYIRMKGLSSLTEWTIFVMDREVGKAEVSDGCLVTSAFTENAVTLWGKTIDNENYVLYLYFEATGKYHEVLFRTELPVVQIDMTEEELALVLPTPSLDEEEEDVPASDETSGGEQGSEEPKEDEQTDNQDARGDEAQNIEEENGEGNGGEQTQDSVNEPEENIDPEENVDHEQNGAPEENGNHEQNGAPEDGGEQNEGSQEVVDNAGQQVGAGANGESGEQQGGGNGGGENNVQQGGTGENGVEENEEENVEEQGGGSEEARCPVCGVLLTEDAAHDEDCINYAMIPVSSEAHDFLDVLPGMRENLILTTCDAENELYTIDLDYLSEEGATAVKTLMRSCNVINESELGDGSKEYRVQKVLGSKVFTFVTKVTKAGYFYQASISVTGYSLG